MRDRIFIQIASYRDPQLVPTIKDAIEQANGPSRLHFCVAWQHGDDETRDIFSDIPQQPQLSLLDILHSESKGTCWARNQIQQQYQGEDYTLQLDSHHRFVKGWDDICIGMVKDLQVAGVEKPLLTSYIPSFDPDNDPQLRINEPWYLAFDRFIPEGAIFFSPATMPNWQSRTLPMKGRFYSAHFAFTLGRFCREVQHNPDYYFHGEEISIAVRAYTHGYDLFHPHKVIAWHEYTRKGRRKHWDDHSSWGGMNISSHAYNRMLFGMDEYIDQHDVVAETQNGKHGFGKERTLEQYERYAGICFRKRGVTQAVLDHIEPLSDDNINLSYSDFERMCLPIFKHCIEIGHDRVPLDDYDFWCVVFKDSQGNDLFRQDADKDEIARMKNDPDGYCRIWRQFHTEVQPKSWAVWPHSVNHGWCKPVIGNL